MKFCPNCRITFEDNAAVCAQCGGQLMEIHPQPASVSYDHTAAFTPEDISENKVLAMVPYLFGWIGIVIALLGAGQSAYASFHVKQALKIQIVAVLVTVVGALIPVLGWMAAGIYSIVSLVICLISFFGVCKGTAQEPALIRNLKFLK